MTAHRAEALLRSQAMESMPNQPRMVLMTPSCWYMKVQTTAMTTAGMTTGMKIAERNRFFSHRLRLNKIARPSDKRQHRDDAEHHVGQGDARRLEKQRVVHEVDEVRQADEFRRMHEIVLRQAEDRRPASIGRKRKISQDRQGRQDDRVGEDRLSRREAEPPFA